jgi:hypothetical protein
VEKEGHAVLTSNTAGEGLEEGYHREEVLEEWISQDRGTEPKKPRERHYFFIHSTNI